MKLPSHLARSRHGVYYFRFSTLIGTRKSETRLSLRTKNPTEAKAKAIQLSLIMMQLRNKADSFMTTDDKSGRAELPSGAGKQGANADAILSPEEWLESLGPAHLSPAAQIIEKLHHRLFGNGGPPSPQAQEIIRSVIADDAVRKLDLEMPNGMIFRNINNEDDVTRMVQAIHALDLSPEQLAVALAGKNPQKVPQKGMPATAPAMLSQPPHESGGVTVQEMVQRYVTRKRNKLSPKTLYEYANYHRKFVEWLEVRKNSKHIPMHAILRTDMADYIDDLLHEGLNERTVQQKYLAAINGLFDLAQTTGGLPEGPLASRGHKLFTKKDLKKADATKGYKPFTDEELKEIFKADNLCNTDQPADFWLPLLGLFTGGRISELCQLDIHDIQQHDGIWAISINDNGDKSLKTLASKRLIPVHPTLIQCGFLDYVADAALFGPKLFPYLNADAFGSYGGTPSDRWGKYLDRLQITDPQKTFHSFRSTSNNRLKQNGVAEESRCQFIGHDYDTTNSSTYSDPHKLDYLLKHVASNLLYPALDFEMIMYAPGQFKTKLAHLCQRKAKFEAHRTARKKREAKRAVQ